MENYDKIKTGMDYSEVHAIIGDADECSQKLGIKNCMWGSAEKHIQINSIADKVVLTSKKDYNNNCKFSNTSRLNLREVS